MEFVGDEVREEVEFVGDEVRGEVEFVEDEVRGEVVLVGGEAPNLRTPGDPPPPWRLCLTVLWPFSLPVSWCLCSSGTVFLLVDTTRSPGEWDLASSDTI